MSELEGTLDDNLSNPFILYLRKLNETNEGCLSASELVLRLGRRPYSCLVCLNIFKYT